MIKYLLIALLLAGCGGKTKTVEVEKVVEVIIEKIIKVENTELNITKEYIAPSTYWCLPQYFGTDRIPKYCAYGSYTHKHIPLAFKANDDIYHVYTDNTQDDNFYVYAAKGNTEKVLVHTIENWNDPHTNAVIHVLESGIVHVHVSSRGINSKHQSGSILASKTPYELDFECIDGCENDNFEGYPQVWEASWGETVVYSHNLYDYDLHPTQWMRTPYSRIGDVRTNLVKGGHYFISYYDDGVLYVAYNLLIDGHPDNRINLYLIKTSDGINWTNINNKALELPLEPHSIDALVYESDDYVYLKDITFNDGLKILFTESTDFDPTIGERFTKEWTVDGIKTITETNHNYNAGAYVGVNILITQDGTKGWIGGDIVLYENYVETARDKADNCAYVRKVINSNDKAVVSCDNFHLNDSASHYILTVD